ncbi:MAG: hypothetical protein Q9P90_14470 [candidate division KSB1 bacterium]|nr:hypothetical protein [candidate division KSB1 bacterium]
MTCNDVERLLESLEAWPERWPPAMQAHLQICSSCRESVAAERVFRLGMAELQQVCCPDTVPERILRETVDSQPATLRTMETSWWLDWMGALLPRPAFVAWMLMIVLISGAMWLSHRFQPQPEMPVARVDIQQTREDIEYAFSILFSTLRKSETVTRELVFRRKLINTTKRSLKIAFPDQLKEGDI